MLDRIYAVILWAQPVPGGGAGAGEVASGAAPGGAVGPGGKPPGCGSGEQLIFMLGMLVLFYFLLIRPQQKRAKQHKELIAALKRGDRVITSSGIFGRIIEIDGNAVTLEIAKNTHVKVLRSHVSGLANPETETELSKNPQAAN